MMTEEQRALELTTLVVKLCRRAGWLHSVIRLLPNGVDVAGLTIDEARVLTAELASPTRLTVRDGERVRVTLK